MKQTLLTIYIISQTVGNKVVGEQNLIVLDWRHIEEHIFESKLLDSTIRGNI